MQPSLTVKPNQGIEQLLKTDGGKDGLVHLPINEAFLVLAEHILEKRRPAPGRRNNEYRLMDVDLPEARKKKSVQSSEERHQKQG